MVLVDRLISLMIPQGYEANLRLSAENVIIRHKEARNIGFFAPPNGLEAQNLKECYHGIEAK